MKSPQPQQERAKWMTDGIVPVWGFNLNAIEGEFQDAEEILNTLCKWTPILTGLEAKLCIYLARWHMAPNETSSLADIFAEPYDEVEKSLRRLYHMDLVKMELWNEEDV